MRIGPRFEALCLSCALLLVACGDDDGGAGGSSGSGGDGGTGGSGATGGSGGGSDAATDSGTDADTDSGNDAGIDSGSDAGIDAAIDSGSDAGTDAATDSGSDAGIDAATAVDASDVDPNPLACKTGHYVGQMTGQYRSLGWGNGEDQASLTVVSIDADDGTPGLELWLARTNTPCAPGVEFCPNLTVTMGSVRGLMQTGATIDLPFEATISGGLDCATGQFRGRLEAGSYNVLGSAQAFDGRLTAEYDTAGSALRNGVWSARDTPVPTCPPGSACAGGEGTWSATFAPTTQ